MSSPFLTPNSTNWRPCAKANGLSPATARTVAEELTAHESFAAHADLVTQVQALDMDKVREQVAAAQE
ncbi:hypothetical protein JOE46_001244 [Rhodococcus sp. PvR099]|nr:hypothetical protein [Rhodococcus sp. PvR099]